MKTTLTALICLLGFATPFGLCGSAAAQQPRTTQPYKLAPGDTLAVNVVNETELSGKFIVDDAGNITIPLIGAIPVGDMTITESQETVRATLARTLLKHPVVAVSIDTLRPVSILGDVRLPGVYPYVPGKIIKMLIAQAGGYGLSELTANPSELLLANERANILATSFDRLSIRKARLEAQLAGHDTFEAPKPLHLSTEAATQLAAEEQAHLDTQIRARAAQIELLESQRPQLLNEEKSIEGQIDAETQQATLLRSRLAEFEKLENKGLSRSSNVIELRLALATKEGTIWALKAQQTRTGIARAELSNRVLELKNQINARLTSELDDIRRQLLELDVTLPSARKILVRRAQAASRSASGEATHTVSIIRQKAGMRSEIEATELTLVEPGDVIEVRAQPLAPTGAGGSTDQKALR